MFIDIVDCVITTYCHDCPNLHSPIAGEQQHKINLIIRVQLVHISNHLKEQNEVDSIRTDNSARYTNRWWSKYNVFNGYTWGMVYHMQSEGYLGMGHQMWSLSLFLVRRLLFDLYKIRMYGFQAMSLALRFPNWEPSLSEKYASSFSPIFIILRLIIL
jgi:hypothetical protein